MTYKEFLANINSNHDPEYYQHLVTFTQDILIDIASRNQHRVAKSLHMTPVKLSHILPLLKALYSCSDTSVQRDTTKSSK